MIQKIKHFYIWLGHSLLIFSIRQNIQFVCKSNVLQIFYKKKTTSSYVVLDAFSFSMDMAFNLCACVLCQKAAMLCNICRCEEMLFGKIPKIQRTITKIDKEGNEVYIVRTRDRRKKWEKDFAMPMHGTSVLYTNAALWLLFYL